MERSEPACTPMRSPEPREMSAADLVRESMDDITLLARRQVELLRLEILQELRQQRRLLVRAVLAASLGLLGISMALIAAASGLAAALALPVWATSLMMAAPLLAGGVLAGGLGWIARVRRLVPVSRSELEKELQWIDPKRP